MISHDFTSDYFPSAAVPSKRDLQAFTKAIHSELLAATLEGERGLVNAVSKELLKSMRLILSKVETMIATGSESSKIAPSSNSPNSQATFSRNSQQEHNAQLVVLLFNLRDGLEKLRPQVVKAVQDATSGASHGSVDSSPQGDTQQPSYTWVGNDVDEIVALALTLVDEVLTRQLLFPLVDALTNYVRTLLLGLLKEGVTLSATSSQIPAKATKLGSADAEVDGSTPATDCSRSVQVLVKQFPELVRAFLETLPRCAPVIAATEEFGLRILANFVSVVAMVRPVTEQMRLRTAKDMSTLEQLLFTTSPISDENCPVVKEFK